MTRGLVASRWTPHPHLSHTSPTPVPGGDLWTSWMGWDRTDSCGWSEVVIESDRRHYHDQPAAVCCRDISFIRVVSCGWLRHKTWRFVHISGVHSQIWQCVLPAAFASYFADTVSNVRVCGSGAWMCELVMDNKWWFKWKQVLMCSHNIVISHNTGGSAPNYKSSFETHATGNSCELG